MPLSANCLTHQEPSAPQPHSPTGSSEPAGPDSLPPQRLASLGRPARLLPGSLELGDSGPSRNSDVLNQQTPCGRARAYGLLTGTGISSLTPQGRMGPSQKYSLIRISVRWGSPFRRNLSSRSSNASSTASAGNPITTPKPHLSPILGPIR